MTNTNLLQAMGRIDPKLITDAAPDIMQKKSANRVWLKRGTMAACLCLVAAGAFRIAIGFIPSQMTDIFREGIQYEIYSIYDLPAEYDGTILTQNLDLSETATIDLYYKEGGVPTSTDDWYSLIIADYQNDRELLIHCMFGDTTVEDWKVGMVFTKDETQTATINGVNVQIARNVNSLEFEHWYYAIFEYDDIVYDIRIRSNNSDDIYDVLNQLLKE